MRIPPCKDINIPKKRKCVFQYVFCGFVLNLMFLLKTEQIVRKKCEKADISTSLWGNRRNFCYKDVVISRKNIIFAEYFVKKLKFRKLHFE